MARAAPRAPVAVSKRLDSAVLEALFEAVGLT